MIRVTVTWEYQPIITKDAYPGCVNEQDACEVDRESWEGGDVDITDLVEIASQEGELKVEFAVVNE